MFNVRFIIALIVMRIIMFMHRCIIVRIIVFHRMIEILRIMMFTVVFIICASSCPSSFA